MVNNKILRQFKVMTKKKNKMMKFQMTRVAHTKVINQIMFTVANLTSMIQKEEGILGVITKERNLWEGKGKNIKMMKLIKKITII